MNPEPALKYFTPEEFACPCCGRTEVNDDLLALVDRARDISGVPFVVSSGFRCPAHNAAVGGSDTSSHLTGFAVDIVVHDRRRGAILAGLINAGFRRIGIAKTFIHVDIDPGKPGAVWLYSQALARVQQPARQERDNHEKR